MLIVYTKGITNALVSFRRIVVKNLRLGGETIDIIIRYLTLRQ